MHPRTFFLTLALVILTACTPGATPTSPPEVKGGGGELRVALRAEPQTLNPDLGVDDAATIIAHNLFNQLVTLDADYRVIPDLAETWDLSADGLTYTFHLAKNVKWHDGQPFTSADVKWTFETIVSAKGAMRETLAPIAHIETPDATTVIIRLKEPFAPFVPMIAWIGTAILPKHIYEGSDWSKHPANAKPIGTGPFKFVEWLKGDHITLAANQEYFRRGPFLDRITYRLYQDPAQSTDALVKGEVEYTLARPSFDKIRTLEQTPGIRVQTFAHPARYYLGFNLRRKPFDDVRVRRAVNMALNRTELVDRALFGYGSPGLGFYTPAVGWAYNAQAQVPAFDRAGAEKLLDQAGLGRSADGTRVEATLVVANLSPFKELATELKTQLHAVGIELTIAFVPTADWTKRVLQERDFDLAMTDGTWGPDPDNLSVRFGSKGANQFMGYTSAEFDAALAEGARRTTMTERTQAYWRAQEILARDLPLAPLAEFVQVIAVRESVIGLPQLEARGLVTFNDYSLVRIKR